MFLIDNNIWWCRPLFKRRLSNFFNDLWLRLRLGNDQISSSLLELTLFFCVKLLVFDLARELAYTARVKMALVVLKCCLVRLNRSWVINCLLIIQTRYRLASSTGSLVCLGDTLANYTTNIKLAPDLILCHSFILRGTYRILLNHDALHTVPDHGFRLRVMKAASAHGLLDIVALPGRAVLFLGEEFLPVWRQ